MTFKGWHLPVTIALSPPPKEGWRAVCYMYCLTQSWGTSGRFQSQHCPNSVFSADNTGIPEKLSLQQNFVSQPQV